MHEYDPPLKSCKPKASVSIRLVLSDDDRVRDRQQTHLQRGEEEESRGELSDRSRCRTLVTSQRTVDCTWRQSSQAKHSCCIICSDVHNSQPHKWTHVNTTHTDTHAVPTMVVLRMYWMICISSTPLESWVKCATWGTRCRRRRIIVFSGASAWVTIKRKGEERARRRTGGQNENDRRVGSYRSIR